MNTNLIRLSDDEIMQIFRTLATWPGAEEGFIKSFAHAITLAPRLDFRAMRPCLLVLIGKYNLAGYLEKQPAKQARTA